MSGHTLATAAPKRPPMSGAIWIAAGIFGLALCAVFALMLSTADVVDQTARDRERSQLASALQQDRDARIERILESALRNLSESARGRPLAASASALATILIDQGILDDVIVVSPRWDYLGGLHRGGDPSAAELAQLRGRLAPRAAAAIQVLNRQPPGDELELVRMLRAAAIADRQFFDDALYAAFLMPVVSLADPAAPGRAQPQMLVLGRKRLDRALLNGIAAPHGIDRVELVRGAAGLAGPGIDVLDREGRVAAHITWSSDLPGDLVRRRLLPLTLAGFGLVMCLFVIAIGYQHWLARDLALTEARSRKLLGRDPLSGLSNRLRFGEQLDHELAGLARSDAGLAVHFIDLDRFKDVNDTYGHQAGDDLIRLVADRLVRTVQPSDLIARFGGDEFAIIQTGVHAAEDAAALARRVLDALTRSFPLAHTQVSVGASIGIALAPQHGTTREVLMGLADTALYQSKSEGRNRFSFFQDRMDTTIQMRKTVEEDLRRAISEDQLVLHYQPLFSADGARIVALEALVRWPHPVRGMISPADFIPIAEERGLIIPLGQWVLRTACRDGTRWPGIRVAVNVSPIEFRHRDFVANVMATLEETGFDPHRLELELTEGVVVEDADAAERAMMELRAAGIHLALDDFGTGYSSLIYLRRFAFDTIKIDRTFLESMETTGESAILVHSMVHLGRALGLTVTAEGVETPEQHRFLQALGCHQLQGFLFSRPVPAAQIDVLLEPSKPLVRAA